MKPFQIGPQLINILQTKSCFAILIDPDKAKVEDVERIVNRLPRQTTHILVGGSHVAQGLTQSLVKALKSKTKLPILLFPGDASQLTDEADGLLFLTLLSGRNPEFLVEQQIKSVHKLKHLTLEIIPTAYILIDGGVETSVQRVSNTQPMSQTNLESIVDTALAGQYSGKKLIYLEAGSGAKQPVSSSIIKAVVNAVDIPVIVGGGIRNSSTVQDAYNCGAQMVVVGTAFEDGMFHYE